MNPLNPVFGNPTLQPETPPTQQLGNNLQPVSENILRQATMEGRTLFASTGDTGSSCAVLVLPVVYAGNGILNQGVPLLTYPAASPYAVGVGGTVLYADGAARAGRYLERAWEFGGGGTSVFLDAPEYQRGLPNLIGRCATDPTGALTNTLQPCRGLPPRRRLVRDLGVARAGAAARRARPDGRRRVHGPQPGAAPDGAR